MDKIPLTNPVLNGFLKEELQIEDGKARVSRTVDTDYIAEKNQKAQNDFSVERIRGDNNWAVPILRMDLWEYQHYLRTVPELSSKDPEIKQKAWMKVAHERPDLRTVSKKYIPSGKRFDKA